MLDNENQLAAFRELNKSGFTPSPSVTLATSTAASAKSLSDQLSALLLATVTYPASIQASITIIKTAAATLSAANVAGADFGTYFIKFQSPSELLNVSKGWECYLKGENLPADRTPALVDALGDKAIVSALSTSLAKVSATAVASVMGEINTQLAATASASAGSTGTGGSTGAATPALSDDLIKRLASACSDLETRSKSLTGVISAVIKLTTDGKQSVDVSKRAFSNAVGISLLNSMEGNAAMGPAIAAITPSAVINALKGGA